MLVFRSEEHIERWCQMWHQPRGETLTLQQGWELAQAWYNKDRQDADWRRYTLEEATAIFARIGMTAPFWSLTG